MITDLAERHPDAGFFDATVALRVSGLASEVAQVRDEIANVAAALSDQPPDVMNVELAEPDRRIKSLRRRSQATQLNTQPSTDSYTRRP